MSPKKYAIVGAGSGIGLACAELLAAQGCGVERLDLNANANSCKKFDVTCEADWSALALENFDGLVVTAGIRIQEALEDTSVESFMKTMQVNTVGAFLAVRAVARSITDRNKKRDFSLVLLSSAVTLKSVPGQIAYNSSKAAIASIVQSATHELRGTGVRLNAVAPGSITTPMTQAGWSDEKHAQRMRGEIPQGRPGNPEEVASVITFLLDKQASYVNGSIWPIDGGWTA